MGKKKDIEYLRNLSLEIDELFDSGKAKEGKELLEKALKESEAIDEAYNLFFEGEFLDYINKDTTKQFECFIKACAKREHDFFLLRNKGVSLSKLDKNEEAIKLYDEALKIKPDDYDSLRQKGVSLSELGKEEEAIKLFNEVLRIKPDDYRSLCSKGVSLSRLGNMEEAIKLFDEVLRIKPDDYRSLCSKGVSLSRLGNMEEAIKLYDEALRIKPDDYKSLCSKGVSLSKLGNMEEAIKLYDEALKIKPDDYKSLWNKGVSLSKLGKEEEAIKLYDEALKIKPDDTFTLAWQAFAYINIDLEKAYNLIKKAKENSKDDKNIDWVFQFITNYYQTKEDKNIPSKEVIFRESDLSGIMGVITAIYEKSGEKIDDFFRAMEKAKEERKQFLSPETRLENDKSLFLVLRKWNSYTPIIPSSGDESVGGGYFLFHNGKGTVIDPGYNFIENFYKAGGRITDINNVILTHAHNDHTIDFESILTLIHQYNKENNFPKESKDYKKINIYLNTGCFMKFSGLLDLRGAEYLASVKILNVDSEFTVDEGFYLKILPAYHDELITKNYAVGLKFILTKGKEKRTILLTSDTGLYPQRKNDSGEMIADSGGSEIWEKYNLEKEKINLLIVHIGSIKREEFSSIEFLKKKEDLEKMIYPNHLGIIGTARIIQMIKPNLAVVSEFGEELKDIQEDLITKLNEVTNTIISQDAERPNVIPGDTPLIYNIFDESVYCVLSKEFVKYDKISFSYPGTEDLKNTCYYYSAEKKNIDKIPRLAGEFESDRGKRKGLYFKP